MTSSKNTKIPTFIAVDFFCGAGGTTRGLIDAGGYVLAGVDKVSACRQVYEDNNVNDTFDLKPARYLHRDIFEKSDDYPSGEKHLLRQDLAELIGKARVELPRVPLMFSVCAPCQPFTSISQEGTMKGVIGKREKDRSLLPEAADLIQEFKPEMILCENVAGIQSAKYGSVWQDFVRRLREVGYVVGSRVVDAQHYGVPQRRRRSIAIAVLEDCACHQRLIEDNGDLSIDLPEEDVAAPIVTVRDAIGDFSLFPPIKAGETHDIIPNHSAADLKEINKRRLASLRPGQNNRELPEELRLACHKRVQGEASPAGKSRHGGFSDGYTRMDPDRPSPTITTRCHSVSNGRYGHFDENQVRAITPREAAALQSFPRDYRFPDRVRTAARMIGNAVPPRLACFFAKVAVDHLRLAGD